MTNHLADRARTWLAATYGGAVLLDDVEPVHANDSFELFGCCYAETDEPMLAATICVPTSDADPFPVANSGPLDHDLTLAILTGGLRRSADSVAPWRWLVNARNCVVAADRVVDGYSATALPWQPTDEAPGWWRRLLDEHFSSAEVGECETWNQVGDAIRTGGPGTRGVVWLRRQTAGRALTGHLLYVQYDEETESAILLDPQLGTLAVADDSEVDRLVLARFHRPAMPAGPGRMLLPWEMAADDFAAAVAKANSWLDHTYGSEATLVAPDPSDQMLRGWLFACTTKRFLRTGDWRDQMLDAALLVPKAAGESPSGLPNRAPWNWLREWDSGATTLPAPPAPGAAAWYGLMAEQIDGFADAAANGHLHWSAALAEIAEFPVDTVALVWLRRKDSRERETVGHLIWAVNRGEQIEIFDLTADKEPPPIDSDSFELRVFRVEDGLGSFFADVEPRG